MAQKANLTSVDKYESDHREAERLDRYKRDWKRFDRSGERHSAGANR
jgi:hypothetical protein